MQRKMTGFYQDAEAHWVAELSCGHTQHVRHDPPFTLRPWVVTLEGRSERLGQTLDCVLCDRDEMPSGYAAYRRTAVFRRESIPAGLLNQHSTKAGAWAVVHVQSGELEYLEPGEAGETRRIVLAGESVIIRPESEHRVAAAGDVEFYVEFWRPAGLG